MREEHKALIDDINERFERAKENFKRETIKVLVGDFFWLKNNNMDRPLLGHANRARWPRISH